MIDTTRCLSAALSLLICAPALAHHESALALPSLPDDLAVGALFGVAALTVALLVRRAAKDVEESQ